MDDGELAQAGGDDFVRTGQGRKYITGDFSPQRHEKKLLADQRDPAAYDDDFRGDDRDYLSDRPAEGLAGVVEHLAGDFIAVRSGLSDDPGGQTLEIAAAALGQVGNRFLF